MSDYVDPDLVLNVTDEQRREFTCAICMGVAFPPAVCGNDCNASFCGACLDRACQTRNACPICNVPVQKTADNKPRQDLRFKARMEMLQIKCQYDACDWIGSITRARAHVCLHAPAAAAEVLPVPDLFAVFSHYVQPPVENEDNKKSSSHRKHKQRHAYRVNIMERLSTHLNHRRRDCDPELREYLIKNASTKKGSPFHVITNIDFKKHCDVFAPGLTKDEFIAKMNSFREKGKLAVQKSKAAAEAVAAAAAPVGLDEDDGDEIF